MAQSVTGDILFVKEVGTDGRADGRGKATERESRFQVSQTSVMRLNTNQRDMG